MVSQRYNEVLERELMFTKFDMALASLLAVREQLRVCDDAEHRKVLEARFVVCADAVSIAAGDSLLSMQRLAALEARDCESCGA